MDCLQPLSLASSWYHVSAGWHLLPNAWSVRRSRCEASRGEGKGGYTLILLYLHVSTTKYVSGLNLPSVLLWCHHDHSPCLWHFTEGLRSSIRFSPSASETFDGLFIRLKICMCGYTIPCARRNWLKFSCQDESIMLVLQLGSPSITMLGKSHMRQRALLTRTETFSSETALSSCKEARSKSMWNISETFAWTCSLCTHNLYTIVVVAT